MEFTDEERQKLSEFKVKMEALLPYDYAKTDLYLVRWLRARDLNVAAAEEMLLNHFKWREVNKIDLLLQGSPDSFYTKNYQYWLNGVDLKGQPEAGRMWLNKANMNICWRLRNFLNISRSLFQRNVTLTPVPLALFCFILVLCSPVGDWDIRRIVEEGRIKEFEDYVNRMYERILEAIRKADERRDPEQPPITQFTLILNWDRFSVRQTANLKAIQTLVNIAATYEAHYPEILSQAFFLNTNQFFQIVFAMMKPILAPRTLSKITCFGTNRSEWEPIVRAVVEEHQIPRQFGG